MKRTRALFKLALWHCKNNIEEIRANACAESLLNQDSRKFCNNIHKISNNKATGHVDSGCGATGSQEVADMWKAHFQRLYSSNINSRYCSLFTEKLTCLASMADARSCLFSMSDIFNALINQKRGKAPGPGGINMETFLSGGHRLKLYLSILFNLFILYG